MPELPEVEVVRAGLAPAVSGAAVEQVQILDLRSLRRHAGPSEDFVDRLTGAGLETPRRRGKFLWIPVHDEEADAPAQEALVVHLGMSGQVLLRTPDAPLDRLTRIVVRLRHPEHGPLRVDFVDQRIFGSMALDALIPTPELEGDTVPTQVAHIARDPMDAAFDERAFLAALLRKNTGIKRALLDQTLISGIGNIYADEALWASRIHYEQPARTLRRAQAKTLLAEVRAVLAKALSEGGTSFDAQYVNVNGASGYFSHSLNAYGQQGEPCPRCGTTIVREVFMNRGSHLCPRCQRLRMPAA